jgi:hypothetical protein
MKNLKREREREKWVVVSDTTGWGGKEFIIWFEGSQALPVCPSDKCTHLAGTIEVQFFLALCRLLGYKTQFIPHRTHITSPLQSSAG